MATVARKCCCCGCACQCSLGMSLCDPCGAPPFLLVSISGISIDNSACCQPGKGGWRLFTPNSTFSGDFIVPCGAFDSSGHQLDNGLTNWTYSELAECLPPTGLVSCYDCSTLADRGIYAAAYLAIGVERHTSTEWLISISYIWNQHECAALVPGRTGSVLLFTGTLTVDSTSNCCGTLTFTVNEQDATSALFPGNCLGFADPADPPPNGVVGSGGTVTVSPYDCNQATIVSVAATGSNTVVITFAQPVTLADNQNGSSCTTRVAFDVEGHYLLPGTGVQTSPTVIEVDVDSYTPVAGDTWHTNDILEWIRGSADNIYPGSGTVI